MSRVSYHDGCDHQIGICEHETKREEDADRADRRRQYACAALTGLLAHRDWEQCYGDVTAHAFAIADVMIAEEERGSA